jgi:hypothetical protein
MESELFIFDRSLKSVTFKSDHGEGKILFFEGQMGEPVARCFVPEGNGDFAYKKGSGGNEEEAIESAFGFQQGRLVIKQLRQKER